MNTAFANLEAESIYILRESAAGFRRPVILFSGGKDSVVLARLAEKAFYPAQMPFEFLMVDTGHNFSEALSFVERRMSGIGRPFYVRTVSDAMARRGVTLDPIASRNQLQSHALNDAITELNIDALISGARRDEDKARAKERIFSRRQNPSFSPAANVGLALSSAKGARVAAGWQPENQEPELWPILNSKLQAGEHMRVFALSNWTELDIWNYIRDEKLEVPSIYFSHERDCFKVGDVWMAPVADQGSAIKSTHRVSGVRVRTVGDMACTALFESAARNVDDVIAELKTSEISERGLRMDDKTSRFSMEERKREGYF